MKTTNRTNENGGNIGSAIDIPEETELDKPNGWQLEVIDIVERKPDLKVHWFWEPSGGGMCKTTLCKYLVVKHNALILSGKSKDMFNIIAKFPNKRTLIVVDVCQNEKFKTKIDYAAIDMIKDGLIGTMGLQLVFNRPHVIVFANTPPDTSAMSAHKWQIVDISNM